MDDASIALVGTIIFIIGAVVVLVRLARGKE